MKLIRMLLVFLIFIALNVYIGIRGAQALEVSGYLKALFTVIYLLIASSVFIAVFLGNKLPLWLARTFETAGGYWIMLFLYILIGVILADLLRVVNHYYPFFPSWVYDHYTKAKLLYLGFVVLTLVVISVIGYIRFSNPAVKEVAIHVNHKARKKDEIKIVMASDLHLGNMIRKGRLERWVKLINQQKPDVIILAGDIFDHNLKAVEMQNMDRVLRKLDSRYGIYAIPGNHDYYAGIDKAMDYIKRSGIMVLRDQWVTIDGRLVLIGRDDLSNKERKPLKVLSMGSNSQLPRILVDHQPLAFKESMENDIDLHLSGHTHNGQIWPISQIVSRMYELGYGYMKKGNTSFYVSSGIGLWGAPIRFGTRSEIVKILLKAE